MRGELVDAVVCDALRRGAAPAALRARGGPLRLARGWEKGLAMLIQQVPKRRCKRCGCTDDHACVVAGVPCCWIGPDLCSACATTAELLADEEAGYPWLVSVMATHIEAVLAQQPIGVPVIWSDGA